MTIPTLFFTLFIYLLSKLHYGDKNSETTKARNLKFRQLIGLFMNLRPSNFGGATSRGCWRRNFGGATSRYVTRYVT